MARTTELDTGYQALGLLVFTVVLIVVIVSMLGGCMAHYGEGEHTGVIIKMSRRGLVYKSWEGSMNLGAAGTNGGGMMVPHAWNFSCQDDSIAKQLMEASESGKRVTVRFHQFFVHPASISTEYVVDGVTVDGDGR